MADGSTERRRIPVIAFANSDTFVEAIPAGATSVRLDPDQMLPDANRSNDAWTR